MFEQDVRRYIAKNGTVDIEWNFIYRNGGSRPTDISYDVYQSGQKVLSRMFSN